MVSKSYGIVDVTAHDRTDPRRIYCLVMPYVHGDTVIAVAGTIVWAATREEVENRLFTLELTGAGYLQLFFRNI